MNGPGTHIWGVLVYARDRYADRLAVVDGEKRWTYGQLHERASSLAAWFLDRGLEPGDRVAIMSLNRAEFLAAYFAASGAGLVLVPVNTRLVAREVASILDHSGSRWVLAARENRDVVDEAVSRSEKVEGVLDLEEEVEGERVPGGFPGGDAPAQIYYTSGTTGRPKGVVLTHGNVITHSLAAIQELGLDGDDVWAHVAPMFHLADAWACFAVTMVGGRHVMLRRFDARQALDLMAGQGITITNLIPTMLNLMVKEPCAADGDFGRLRLLLSGGAPIAPGLVRDIMVTFGCEYVQTYGMTETSPYLTVGILDGEQRALPLDEQVRLRARTGRPFRTVSLQVVDDSGDQVPADGSTVGEIRVQGPTVTPGYWDDEEQTRRALVDGWLMTGDLAVRYPDGFVDIVDRRKDMIITGGENVYSVEVESVLYEHPAVLEAAVVGRKDQRWGEVVAAVVALREGMEVREEDLRQHCRLGLAGYKVPRTFRFVQALPRTGSGKIDKKPLRE